MTFDGWYIKEEREFDLTYMLCPDCQDGVVIDDGDTLNDIIGRVSQHERDAH